METVCENRDTALHLKGVGGYRLTSEALAKYAGTYKFGLGREAVITVDGPTLILKVGKQPPQAFTMVPQSERHSWRPVLESEPNSTGAPPALLLGLRSPPERVWARATGQPAWKGPSARALRPVPVRGRCVDLIGRPRLWITLFDSPC